MPSSKKVVARYKSCNILENIYDVSVGKEVLRARREGNRIEFILPGKIEPLGRIEFGSPWSGAIWLYNECIGEFKHIEDIYTVIPISGYRKRLAETIEIDPIAFLFRKWKEKKEIKPIQSP